MQAYFEPEQAFSISMHEPVFDISIAYKTKTCIALTSFSNVCVFIVFIFCISTEQYLL